MLTKGGEQMGFKCVCVWGGVKQRELGEMNERGLESPGGRTWGVLGLVVGGGGCAEGGRVCLRVQTFKIQNCPLTP